jgi:hypothetical protein
MNLFIAPSFFSAFCTLLKAIEMGSFAFGSIIGFGSSYSLGDFSQKHMYWAVVLLPGFENILVPNSPLF